MKELESIVDPLVQWYHKNKRDLPWRRTKDPYAIWVSEIMLQQTRVEAVKPYYERFLLTLPTIKDLAEAEEAVILKLWEGLGYYSRVRNMQRAAQRTVSCQSKGFTCIKGHWALYGRRSRFDCIWTADSCGRWKCASGDVPYHRRCV